MLAVMDGQDVQDANMSRVVIQNDKRGFYRYRI